jgi:hypothetical protein
MSKGVCLLAGAAAIATCDCKVAYGQYSGNAAYIETLFSGTPAVTYSSSPVITAIGSAPVGALDGYNYTSWSFLAQDTTGSLDIFGALPGGYTPTLGDAITATGTYAPFHQISELGSITAISAISAGNPIPSPVAYTIPQMTASGTGVLPGNLSGYLVSLNNVTLYSDAAATIPATGNFATHANVALYAKDASGNIIETYVWESSYSVDGAMGGKPIPTGTVDMTGFVSQSSTFPPEFTPFSITQVVPEPSVLNLFGAGSVLAFLSRFRKKA